MSGPIQGLRVSLNLADIADPTEAFNNLDLNIRDVDRIRGIAAEGVLPEDIRTFSGLTSDFEKELIGIYDETINYSSYLSPLNDPRSDISVNMFANTSLVAASFKFNAVAANGTVVSSELSTSRVSAWSSLGNTLYYGAKVSVASDVELSSLTIDRPVRQKRFESEVPTHKVRIKIDGVDYDSYAMKNIPIRLTGFFSVARNVSFTVSNARPGGVGPYLRPSWIVRDNDNGAEVTYTNILTGSLTSGLLQNRDSTINFTSARAKERDILFYYPVDFIRGISLPNLRLYNFPSVVMNNMTTASLAGSDFREMPDFRRFTPNLTSLDISNINLMRSNDSTLRLFNQNVVNRLPTTLSTFVMDNSFGGVSSANLEIMTNLSTLIARGWGGRRMSGTTPAVNAARIETYDVAANVFSELHPTVRQSDTLKILNISNNNFGPTANVQISATNQVIEEIYNNVNTCSFIDASNKPSLRVYNRISSTATGTVTNLFVNCSNLRDISIQSTRITGSLPSFATNIALSRFNALTTLINNADPSFAITNNTFGTGVAGGCRPTIEQFLLSSPNLSGTIPENALDNLIILNTFHLSSNRTTGITGSIPQLRQSSILRDLNLSFNRFTGTMPTYSFNSNLIRLNLSFNDLTGQIPGLNLPRLNTLLLNNNSFDELGVLQCPSLVEINVSNNLITRVPSFSGCANVRIINMARNTMGASATAYSAGTFIELPALRRLDLSNCGLQRAAVDQILIDLARNYDASPRGQVEINLLGNAAPSATNEIRVFVISRLRAAGWTIRIA